MKFKIKSLVFLLIIMACTLVGCSKNTREDTSLETRAVEGRGPVNPDRLIAHGGGEIYGLTYTNSLEALNNSYQKGFKYIEVDFKFTKDNKLVLIHDWNNSVDWLFNMEAKVLNHKEFKEKPKVMDLTLMDLDDLISWLKNHKDVYIITDTEDDNERVLGHIKEKYPKYIKRFIPQIYKFDQYEKVKKLGYEDIIFTLYLCNNPDDEIVEFVKNHDLYGVTIERTRAYGDLTEKIGKLKKTRIFSHTINSIAPYRELTSLGVYGFYTDYLEINNFFKE